MARRVLPRRNGIIGMGRSLNRPAASIICLPAVGTKPKAIADGSIIRRICDQRQSLGPYIDKGLVWPDVIKGVAGRGHNVTALVMPDGRYAVFISETRPGSIYISKSWTDRGSFKGNYLYHQ